MGPKTWLAESFNTGKSACINCWILICNCQPVDHSYIG